jgi:hypothetical protein
MDLFLIEAADHRKRKKMQIGMMPPGMRIKNIIFEK